MKKKINKQLIKNIKIYSKHTITQKSRVQKKIQIILKKKPKKSKTGKS